MSIIKKSIQETTGNSNNIAQSFKQNILFASTDGVTSPFIFEMPKYSTNGGTRFYQSQDPRAIFTNLAVPFIRFDFSANTSSFGPTTFIKHDIYRISWDLFNTIQSGLKAEQNEAIQSENLTTETIEELDESTGQINRKTITKTKNEIQNSIKSSRKTSNFTANRQANKITKPTIADLQKQLSEPIFSITASTTGITTNIYDFQIAQYIKNSGAFKTELFQDRDQYIIDTNIIFNRTVTPMLTDLKIINSNGIISNENYSSNIISETISNKEIIIDGEFKGLEFVAGDYFSYFQVPDKPIFEFPTPSGKINTFTPEIFWTNGENADEYLVQVTYNTGDTGFTGTIFSYPIPKLEDFKEKSVSKIKDSTSEFSTDKTIRKYQLSLKSNKCLLYRVGNVKTLTNLFGVKQSVITFSDYNSICTQVEPIKTLVFTESDSPFTSEIVGLSNPSSLEVESPLAEYSLSGVVSGSIISGATMQLIYPNLSFITQSTDIYGNFMFTELESGTYTLNTTYRGYVADSRQVVINSNTTLNFDVEIIWSNDFDIWAIKENDTIKY